MYYCFQWYFRLMLSSCTAWGKLLQKKTKTTLSSSEKPLKLIRTLTDVLWLAWNKQAKMNREWFFMWQRVYKYTREHVYTCRNCCLMFYVFWLISSLLDSTCIVFFLAKSASEEGQTNIPCSPQGTTSTFSSDFPLSQDLLCSIDVILLF